MKTGTIALIISAIVITLLAIGCSKEEEEKEYNQPDIEKNFELQKLVLGKWIAVQRVYSDEILDIKEKGTMYEEFCPDWLIRYYSIETGEYGNQEYRIDSSHIHFYDEDGSVMFREKYSLVNDTLTRKITYGLITSYNITVYKRINE